MQTFDAVSQNGVTLKSRKAQINDFLFFFSLPTEAGIA
jgi:hypothetical protein